MLIRHAEIAGIRLADVRIEAGLIGEIAAGLPRRPCEPVLEAAGAALLPGLHDHHIHLLALAKALESVPCGPPEVVDASGLAQALRDAAAAADATDWLRGIGYHESVAGDIDRAWLDRVMGDRPIRIQHRSGRLWILNSRALELLGEPTEGDGRRYDADDWLRARLPGGLPSLRQASTLLAGLGVTGVTDASPANGLAEFQHCAAEQDRGHLLQDVTMMGGPGLDRVSDLSGLRRGATKVHLHESALPEFDGLCATIRHSHSVGRPVAVHCVTVTELVFAAGAFAEAGARPGDRIEHASVAPPDVLPMLAAQGLAVVTQPNFILERGDAYLKAVAAEDLPWLYRGRGFLAAGIPLAGSSDAPFGRAQPWLAMETAVRRRSRAGIVLGAGEALSPEQALALFTGCAERPGGPSRTVAPGAPADLCLIDRPWSLARQGLAAVRVQATIKAGRLLSGAETAYSR